MTITPGKLPIQLRGSNRVNGGRVTEPPKGEITKCPLCGREWCPCPPHRLVHEIRCVYRSRRRFPVPTLCGSRVRPPNLSELEVSDELNAAW